MSEALLGLSDIKELLSRHVPLDPVALSMLPPESRELVARMPEVIEKLLVELVARDGRIQSLSRDAKNMEKALEMYANNSGDVLFSQNLELCLRQVTS